MSPPVRLLRLGAAPFVCLLALAAAPPPKPAPLSAKQRHEMLQERYRLWQQVQKLRAAGKLTEAVEVAEKWLVLERRLFGDQDERVILPLQWLAMLHEDRGDFAAARMARREGLAIQTRRLGAGHWEVTDARLALETAERSAKLPQEQRQKLALGVELSREALRLYKQGRVREALPLAQQAVTIRKAVLGEKDPNYTLILNNLALLYFNIGDDAAALKLFLRTRELKKEVLGERHPAYASTLHNLALLYANLGDYFAALKLYEQARALRKEVLGEKHPDYAATLYGLARLYHVMGDHPAALKLYLQVRDIQKAVLGERHPA
jgi:tetratricopeptide (TPR) repeat protein